MSQEGALRIIYKCMCDRRKQSSGKEHGAGGQLEKHGVSAFGIDLLFKVLGFPHRKMGCLRQ